MVVAIKNNATVWVILIFVLCRYVKLSFPPKQMKSFRCCYRMEGFNTFNQIIQHCIDNHENDKLKIQLSKTTSTETVIQTKNFQIIPAEIRIQGKYIQPFAANYTVRIQRTEQINCSPFKKIQKRSSTPLKANCDLNFLSSDNENDENDDQNLSSYFEELSLLEDSKKDNSTQRMIVYVQMRTLNFTIKLST